ncbi:MAG: phosphotyrosine protein phosphatase [Lysobacterales bacterium 14-68-21]|jgi:protein-tyrosine phosphatase|nr:MAG: phosphotyrosine protein phosphatase [Xanthomonadales bacterium 15-68-25]OZB64809.1 MAG: phosphotyrosine protein phosphatase [Xanthomonadales bacterium 14-68-21]
MSGGELLIVCLGNICRSPVVAEVVRQRFAAAGRAVAVDSCGTGGWHVGHRADARMREAARAAGYDLSAHRARQIEVADFQRFERVLGMDQANLRDLAARCPQALRHKLDLFLPAAGIEDVLEVPDPYYGGPEDFRHVIALAERGAEGLLARLGG